MTESNEDATEQRPFASVLLDLNKGRTHAQLGDELRAVLAAVRETGKPGSLTLKLDVKPLSGNDDGVTVTARIGSKQPAFEAPASIFFLDAENNLNRNPVNQANLFEEISQS